MRIQELIVLANRAFEEAVMPNIVVVGSDSFDTNDPKDFIKKVYFEWEGEKSESSLLGSFHVQFDAAGKVTESYMYEVNGGNEIYTGIH